MQVSRDSHMVVFMRVEDRVFGFVCPGSYESYSEIRE